MIHMASEIQQHQQLNSNQKPPLARTGSRPGSRKARIIYPSAESNKAQDDTYNGPNLIIKLNNSTQDQPLRNETSRTNKENFPGFLSPMTFSGSQSNLPSPAWKLDTINNHSGISNITRLGPSATTYNFSVSEDKSLVEQFTEENKSILVEGSQLELNRSLDLSKQTSEVKKKIPKWKTLKSVFHSLLLFNREEVKSIDNAHAISQEVEQFELRKQPNNTSSILQPIKANATQDALDLLRRINILCDCAAVGSPGDLDKIRNILKNDPKRYLWAPEDAEHIINSYNSQGQTPIHIAAKNGNLEVVRLLVESRANHQLKSKAQPHDKSGETPLDVAVRWDHLSIVNYLLQNCKHDVQDLAKTVMLTQNVAIKKKIMSYIKQNKGRRKFSLFACGKY